MVTADNFLNRVDLNLLKVFKAVHTYRQTTAAANHLGLTQSAVSQSLKRLRDMLGDPLFVPTKAGMEPTQRANELAGPVSDALAAIERAFRNTSDFDAGRAERRFRIGMLDYAVMALAPKLAAAISRRAPGVTVEISHVPQADAIQLLLTDALDLVTGPFPKYPSALEATPLFSDSFVAVSRRNHPALSGRLTKRLFTQLRHVDIPAAYGEAGNLDRVLISEGAVVQKAMQVPTFAGACFVAGESEFLAIVPKRIAEVHQDLCGLAIHRIPVAIPPLEVSALIHRRNSSDAGLQWLLSVLNDVTD